MSLCDVQPFSDGELLRQNPFSVYVLQTTISDMSLMFSSNTEAYASELLEDIGKLFSRYYMDSDIFDNVRSKKKVG